MLWTYDLLVLGSSLAALQGAVRAATVCRVGLIQAATPDWELDCLSQALMALPLGPVDVGLWLTGQLSRWQSRYGLAALAQAGIDVLTGPGKLFTTSQGSQGRILLEGDQLQAQRYLWVDQPRELRYRGQGISVLQLLATLRHHPPALIYLPGQDLFELTLLKLCLALKQPVAWGGDFSQLLAQDDPILWQWLGADLANAGVQCLDPDANIPEDCVCLTVIRRPECIPPTDGSVTEGLLVNQGLQATRPGQLNHHVCGSWLGGYGLPMICQAEVNYLLSTWFLGGSTQPINYKALPWWLSAPIPIGRIGWHPTAAERVFKQPLQTLSVQPEYLDMGQGHIVIDSRQRLLGASLWGPSAIHAVKTLGLGMGTRIVGDCLGAAGWQIAQHPRQWA